MGIPFEKHTTSVTAKPVNIFLSKLSNHAVGSVFVNKNYVF